MTEGYATVAEYLICSKIIISQQGFNKIKQELLQLGITTKQAEEMCMCAFVQSQS